MGTLVEPPSAQYQQLNPSKKQKTEHEQHIPDEIFHDFYVDPMRNDDHSVPNNAETELEEKPIESGKFLLTSTVEASFLFQNGTK